MTTLTLREATADDAELLFAWRNEPSVRESSFNSGAIELDDHRRWLATKLAARDDTRIWIAMQENVPIGQIRYDRKSDTTAEISFSIDSRFRGRGLGSELLMLSAPRACRELGVSDVRGSVKPSNVASLRAFERAGFQRVSESDEAIAFALISARR